MRYLLPLMLLSLLNMDVTRADCSFAGAPAWVHEMPQGFAFDYFVGRAEDQESPVRASKAAVSNAISNIIAKGLITVTSEVVSAQTERSSARSAELLSDISEEVRVKGHSTKLEGLEQVEIHTDSCNGINVAFALIRLPAKKPKPAPTAWTYTWRSLLLPGWGQFEKNHPGKGLTIALGEVVLIPAAITMWVLSNNYLTDAAATNNQDERDWLEQRSNLTYNVFLGALVAAAGLYVYNVIDVVASEPTNIYAQGSDATPDLRFAVTPLPGGAHAVLDYRF